MFSLIIKDLQVFKLHLKLIPEILDLRKYIILFL